MLDFKLTEKDANELYDILVEHMGAKDDRYWRGEFLQQFVNKGIPYEFWFQGIGGTGWKLWCQAYSPTPFYVQHEEFARTTRQEHVDAANDALRRVWNVVKG